MKLTADTITDEQIRELRKSRAAMELPDQDYEAIDIALGILIFDEDKGRRAVARARCAEIWNARAEGK